MNKKEKTTIIAKVSVLNNKMLRSVSRAGTMISFGFGDLVESTVAQKTDDGKIITKKADVPQYALHIDCSFRINCGDKIMMSQRDIFCPSSEKMASSEYNEDEFEWDLVGNNRFDEESRNHFVDTTMNFFVKKITISDVGDLTISLTNDFSIDVFVDSSENEECWRFFEIGNADNSHLVVTGEGVYEE